MATNELKHAHAEAFMLMRYRCRECSFSEFIWNSRDGVTPFGIPCRNESCSGTMNHIAWQNDLYLPDHAPMPGQRYFRDGTPDEAAEIMAKRIELFKDKFPVTPEKKQELIEGARNAHKTGDANFHEFQKGWPMLVEAQ